MSTFILALALYIISTVVAAHDNADEDLTIEEWKILKKEYFLQQLMEKIEEEPKLNMKKATEAELPNIIAKMELKNKEKRSGDLTYPNSCSSTIAEDKEHPCCLDSFEVDFHKLGWNFIVSPKTIQYKFCRGSCNPEFVRPALFTKAAAQVLYVSITFILPAQFQ